jgi:hypothetical protein
MRVREHEVARAIWLPHPDLMPVCTPEERWRKPTVWAVYAPGKTVKAAKLHDNAEDAAAHAERIGGEVQYRAGEDTRCEEYCEVSRWCPYLATKGETE